jgi:hypothetical protein
MRIGPAQWAEHGIFEASQKHESRKRIGAPFPEHSAWQPGAQPVSRFMKACERCINRLPIYEKY